MILPDRRDVIHKAWLYRLLTAICDDTMLTGVLYFKGGTCAAMRGLLDRFSIDLDFDFIGGVDEMITTHKHLEKIFNHFGLEIKINQPPAKQVAWGLRPYKGLTVLQKPPNSGKRVQGKALPEPPPEAAFALDKSSRVPQYILKYPNSRSNERNTLKIDVAAPPPLANKYEKIRLDEIDRILTCQTAATMFANKLVALIDRYEKSGGIAGRDLYDIHYFFLNGNPFEIDVILERRKIESIKHYLGELIDFIEIHITQIVIDQDLSVLLPPAVFRKIRKFLKSETLIFLKDELKRH